MRYLGLSIDVGPATAKILIPTGEAVHCNQQLITEKLADPDEQDHMHTFLWMAEDRWGTCLARGHLEEVGLIDMQEP